MKIKKAEATAVVVNNDPTQLAALRELLATAGIEARVFTEAEAALKAMNPLRPPDLIITGLYMPGIDGWRFCRLLRSSDYAPFGEVPILVVSSTHGGEYPRSIATEVGANALLSFPVSGEAFLTQVHALLAGKVERILPRVLIVENDNTFAGMLKKAFAANGFHADVSQCAAEAEEMIAWQSYEVAVIARHLPDRDGAELLDIFRTRLPDCACLLVASDSTPELALSWMKRGAAAYLCKPIVPEVLIEQCHRARRERALLRSEDLLEERGRKSQESEAYYRALFESVSDAVLVHEIRGDGIPGKFIAANRVALKRLGYSREELLQLTPRDLVLQGEFDHLAGARSNLVATGSAMFKTVHHRADGRGIPVESHVSILELGERRVAVSVVRDITERQRAEEADRRRQADRDLIAGLATEAIKTENLPGFQAEMLRLLGEALDVSRSYIFTFRHHGKTMDNTAEWTASGVLPQCDRLRDIPADIDWWWIATLMGGETIDFADITEIPDQRTVAELAAQDIRAVLVWPLFIGTRFGGFIGLDECRSRREWSSRERNLLAEAARILMGVWAGEELRRSEERFRGILQNVPTVAVQGYAMDGTVRYWNRASEAFYGYSEDEALGRNLLDLIIPPGMRDEVRAAIAHMVESGESIPASELLLMRKDGSLLPVYSSHALVRVPGREPELFCIDIDLTERKQAEQEREMLQTQLIQAQKMESVGRLAGGVAHDFNNMLAVILGYVDLGLEQIQSDSPLHGNLEQVRAAAQRSADLTQQLLAFARKQTVAPKVLDLNETVEGMLKLLRRLIGEDIDLVWLPGRELWPVKMDQSQLDQILANLCVNARDAIAGVGKVTIETGTAVIDEEHGARLPDSVPGDYVVLSVSDDGCGMAPETLSRIFEPFFTTKEVGRGTGLGLASVYGAVKQNQGFIAVASAVGRGTTFRLYLPRHRKREPERESPGGGASLPGSETILLVEDEPMFLELTTAMLERLGYTVVAAGTPGEALRLAREYGGRIDLLITDVVMPEMNGRELAKRLLSLYPGMKRLFMSGYTANVIADHDLLEQGVHFLAKPFSRVDLGEKIREALR